MDEERLAILEEIAQRAHSVAMVFKSTDDWAFNMRVGGMIQCLARLENYDARKLDLTEKT